MFHYALLDKKLSKLHKDSFRPFDGHRYWTIKY